MGGRGNLGNAQKKGCFFFWEVYPLYWNITFTQDPLTHLLYKHCCDFKIICINDVSEFSTYYDWAKYFLEAGSGTSEAPGIGQPEMELYFAKYSKLKTVLGGIMNKSKPVSI